MYVFPRAGRSALDVYCMDSSWSAAPADREGTEAFFCVFTYGGVSHRDEYAVGSVPLVILA